MLNCWSCNLSKILKAGLSNWPKSLLWAVFLNGPWWISRMGTTLAYFEWFLGFILKDVLAHQRLPVVCCPLLWSYGTHLKIYFLKWITIHLFLCSPFDVEDLTLSSGNVSKATALQRRVSVYSQGTPETPTFQDTTFFVSLSFLAQVLEYPISLLLTHLLQLS